MDDIEMWNDVSLISWLASMVLEGNQPMLVPAKHDIEIFKRYVSCLHGLSMSAKFSCDHQQ